jgi:hypothetical protein
MVFVVFSANLNLLLINVLMFSNARNLTSLIDDVLS